MRKVVFLAAAALLPFVVAGCRGDDDDTAPSSSDASDGTVTIEDFAFVPDTITLKAPSALKITNADNQPHTFTSDDTGVFDTGAIPAGGSPEKPVTVMKPGTYELHCSFHPFMHGTLVVE